MEWIDSPDLGDQSWCSFIDHLFLGNEQDAVRVLTDMAKALEHLREHNIVNHDIKASNILYSRRNGAVLIDFGLAITNQTDDEAMTFNGGTAWYIEPNLAAGRHMPEDVWALGIVLLYMLRLIPLPEQGIQARAWSARDARDLSSEGHQQMRRWHHVLLRVVERLNVHNYLHSIILRMLHPTPQERITPGMIREALRQETVAGPGT